MKPRIYFNRLYECWFVVPNYGTPAQIAEARNWAFDLNGGKGWQHERA